MTAWRRVQNTVRKEVEVGTVIGYQLPKKLSIVLLDAKHFKIRREPYTLYVAFDPERKKPLCWLLLPRNEMREGYEQILHLFRFKRYNIEAFVTDWHTTIVGTVKDWHPKAVHQRCAAHLLQEVFRKIGGRRLYATEYGKELWKIFRKGAIGFEKQGEARRYLNRMKLHYPERTKGFEVLEKGLDGIYQFTKRKDLLIPRTSNAIENFMGVLEQRLKTFRSAKSPEALIKIISQLIKFKY